MVLTENQAEVTPKGFLEKREFNSFMVLDTTSVVYSDDHKVFGYSIEILNLIRVTFIANKMCLDFKSSFCIDTDIYHKAINNVLTYKSFSDSELENYFITEQKKEEFLKFSCSLFDIENNFYLPYEVDYILLGINIDLYNNLDEIKKEELHESYGDIACDVRLKQMKIKDFILKARELLVINSVMDIISE
ncbi:MAG: hypothetical protein ABI549_13290 [Flavobacterium sp.]|uniref:hypothetical protein n=1 Tax=Flavobacterium sp. TaxID=239 RepID=UPI003266EB98